MAGAAKLLADARARSPEEHRVKKREMERLEKQIKDFRESRRRMAH